VAAAPDGLFRRIPVQDLYAPSPVGNAAADLPRKIALLRCGGMYFRRWGVIPSEQRLLRVRPHRVS
jgi:hypothetical protein